SYGDWSSDVCSSDLPIVVTSFDGTPIVCTLILPAGASPTSPVPVVLETHGWGGSRDTTPSSFDQLLLDNGYAVFTWDARGFGQRSEERRVGKGCRDG